MTNQLVAKGEAPQGWVWARLGDIVEFEYGKGLRKDRRDIGGRVPVYGSNGILGYHSDSLVRYPCVVIGRKGAIGQVHLSKTPCWPIDTTYYVCPPDCISLAFSYLLLCYLRLGSLDRSTAIPGLNRDDAYRLAILVPPLAEQDRIVARIEELFTRLDAGVEALTKVKTQLKRYRQAILKHAFEGKLTAEWRQANEHQLEPASVLLESISQELHTSKGTKLVPLDTSDLPGLPGSWTWTNVSRIAHLVRGVSYPKEESSKEPRHGYIPILRANNIDRELNLLQLVYVPRKRVSDEQLVKSLDILIAMSSGSRDLVGKACQASRDLEAGFGAFCGIIRVVPDMDRTYVGFFFQSPSYRNQVSRLSSGVNINNLRRDHIESMPIPLPPLSEQRHIVEEIERRFSVADNIERTVDQGLKQADRLRQSILKRAFEGKLVPQDPNDEPAAKLLERIRAEKAEQQAGTKSIKAARKKATTEEMRLR